jgi:hypothetical protein
VKCAAERRKNKKYFFMCFILGDKILFSQPISLFNSGCLPAGRQVSPDSYRVTSAFWVLLSRIVAVQVCDATIVS